MINLKMTRKSHLMCPLYLWFFDFKMSFHGFLFAKVRYKVHQWSTCRDARRSQKNLLFSQVPFLREIKSKELTKLSLLFVHLAFILIVFLSLFLSLSFSLSLSLSLSLSRVRALKTKFCRNLSKHPYVNYILHPQVNKHSYPCVNQLSSYVNQPYYIFVTLPIQLDLAFLWPHVCY